MFLEGHDSSMYWLVWYELSLLLCLNKAVRVVTFLVIVRKGVLGISYS